MSEQVVPNNSMKEIIKNIEYIGFRTVSEKVVQFSTEELIESLRKCKDNVSRLKEFTISNSLVKQLSSLLPTDLSDESKIFKKPSKVKSFKVPVKRENDENIEPSKDEKRRKLESENKEIQNNTHLHNDLNGCPIMDYSDTFSSSDSFVGFKTASGKNINISEKALNLVRSRWNEEDYVAQEIPKEERALSSRDLNFLPLEKEKYSKNCSTMSFKTASGREIPISEEALKLAQSRWNDDELNSYLNSSPNENTIEKEGRKNEDFVRQDTTDNKDMEVEMSFVGFKTASGKDIHISKEILQKFRTRIENEEMEIACSDSSNKKMSPNFAACTKGDIMNGEDTSRSRDISDTNKNFFVGFQTASGKSITISEDALQHVRNKWKDEEDSTSSEICGAKLNNDLDGRLENRNIAKLGNFERFENNFTINTKSLACLKPTTDDSFKASQEHIKNQWKENNLERGSDATLTSSLNSNAEDDDWLEDAAILCDVLQARERERNNQKEFILSKADVQNEIIHNEISINKQKRTTLREALKSKKVYR